MRLSLFKLPKNSTFDYKPIYYDAEKEAMEERKKEHEKLESKDNSEEYIPDIKGKFKSNVVGTNSTYRSQTRISNIRLFVIICLLFFVAYYLLKSEGMMSVMFDVLLKK